MAADALVFRVHALKRMAQRHVTVADVRQVLATGELIEAYPEVPSRLVPGWSGGRPLHVVAAED